MALHISVPPTPQVHLVTEQTQPPSFARRRLHSLSDKVSNNILHLWVISLLLLISAPFLRLRTQASIPAQETGLDDTCTSIHDAPNPIANDFPHFATGVLNGTVAIIPVELARIREVIPARMQVLEDTYRTVIPEFPEGMYPVLLQAAHDHDVQLAAAGLRIPDFSVRQKRTLWLEGVALNTRLLTPERTAYGSRVPLS